MCWIAITTKDKLRETLLNQKDRWLDSLGVISKEWTHRIVRQNYKGYKKYIRNVIKDEGLLIMHHRKATIWAVTPENAHPFQGKYFQLMQNWTAQTFYNWHKSKYWKETDTETLLNYIEDRTVVLEEIPDILKQISERLKEDLWIIIVVDNKRKQFLFYADWARETYIDIDNIHLKINGIYNYEPTKDRGFENVWYMVLDFDFNIIENKFEELNSKTFMLYYSGTHWFTQLPTPKSKNSSYSYYNQYMGYWVYDDWYDYYEYTNPSYSKKTNKNKSEWDSFNDDEREEYKDIIDFLTGQWCSDSIYNVEQAFEDYLKWYYGLDMETNLWEYFNQWIRLEKVFKYAYKEVFWL
jgi:hypothetical protein